MVISVSIYVYVVSRRTIETINASMDVVWRRGGERMYKHASFEVDQQGLYIDLYMSVQ